MTVKQFNEKVESVDALDRLYGLVEFTTSEERLKILLDETEEVGVDRANGYYRALRKVVRRKLEDLTRDLSDVTGVKSSDMWWYLKDWFSENMYQVVDRYNNHDEVYDIERGAGLELVFNLFQTFEKQIVEHEKEGGKK